MLWELCSQPGQSQTALTVESSQPHSGHSPSAMRNLTQEVVRRSLKYFLCIKKGLLKPWGLLEKGVTYIVEKFSFAMHLLLHLESWNILDIKPLTKTPSDLDLICFSWRKRSLLREVILSFKWQAMQRVGVSGVLPLPEKWLRGPKPNEAIKGQQSAKFHCLHGYCTNIQLIPTQLKRTWQFISSLFGTKPTTLLFLDPAKSTKCFLIFSAVLGEKRGRYCPCITQTSPKYDLAGWAAFPHFLTALGDQRALHAV